MMRVIVTPAQLPPAALAELKQWLGLTVADDDAALTALLMAALDLCADFTGLVPIAETAEETLPASGAWQTLATRPVREVSGAEWVLSDGSRSALASSDYVARIGADGTALVRVTASGPVMSFDMLGGDGGCGALAPVVAVRFVAGLSADWDSLPQVLRQGVMRLAAHQYRARESDNVAAALPPASVAALWRPWRRMRLA